MLSTLVVSLKGELGDLINDVLSTSRVTGRDKELGEDNLLGSSPAFGLPESPILSIGVEEVIEDSFLLVELLLGTDCGEGSSRLFEHFLVELNSVISLHETTHSPGESVDENLLVALTVNLLRSLFSENLNGSFK
jgi:hypothetical protein